MPARIQLGIIGDRNLTSPTHQATDSAIQHAAAALGLTVEAEWIPTPQLASNAGERLQRFSALWCAPGSPYQSMEGALAGIEVARVAGIPFLGTCAGFQHAVIEYARNVLGFQDAQHAEYDSSASCLFVNELACSLLGETMTIHLRPGSKVSALYGRAETTEQYYCRFGINPVYTPQLEQGGLRVSGVDAAGEARIVELPGHPFFIATLYVPQLASTAQAPHPLILGYLHQAANVPARL